MKMAPLKDEDDEHVLFDARKMGFPGNTDDEDDDEDARTQLLNNKYMRAEVPLDGNCVKVTQTIFLCFAFCGLGLCLALPGPTMIDLQEITNSNTESITRIFTGRSIGYLLGSIVGGLVFDHCNKFFLLSVSMLLAAVGNAAAPWCVNIWLMVAMFVFVGVAMGMLDTGGNALCISLWGRASPPFLQALHFAFGLGAFVAPLIAEPFLSTTNATYVTAIISTTTGPVGGVTYVRSTLQARDTNDRSRDIRSVDDNLLSNATILYNNITTTPASIKLPKKPNTDGRHLSSEGHIASGNNINKQLVKETLEKLKDQKKQPLILVTTATITNNNNETSAVSMATVSTSNTSISVERTTPVIATSPEASSTTTPEFLSTSVSQSSTTSTSNVTSSTTSSVTSLTSRVTSTMAPGFERTLYNLKEKVINVVHYVEQRISKVKIAYLIVSLFILVVGISFCFICCCDRKQRSSSATQKQYELTGQVAESAGFKCQLILLMCFFLLSYVGMEVTYGGLVMSFSVDYLHWSKKRGSYVTSLFWGSFAMTRGLCIVVARFMRPAVMIIIDLTLTVVTLLVMLFTVQTYPVSMWVGTAVLGMGMASIFPAALSWAERYINVTSKVSSVLVTACALGEMALPMLTGFLFNKMTPMYLIYVLFAGSLACCVTYIILQKLTSKHGEKYSLITVDDDNDVYDVKMMVKMSYLAAKKSALNGHKMKHVP